MTRSANAHSNFNMDDNKMENSNKNIIREMKPIRYAVPFNDKGMKRAREIEVYDGSEKEYFLIHQMNDRGKAIETVIVGALDNYNPDIKMKPCMTKFMYDIKDKKFGRDIYSIVKEKAISNGMKGEVKFWEM